MAKKQRTGNPYVSFVSFAIGTVILLVAYWIVVEHISSNRVWIITLACLDLFFIFLAWLANPDYFIKTNQIIVKYNLYGICNLYISPVFGLIEPEEIVDFMKENVMNDVNMQIQLHKIIWSPDKKGV